MEFRILHFYPDLMNLYGSYANVTIFRRLLERLGHSIVVETVAPGGTADLSGADFVYMGAGTERRARFAMEDFARYADTVKSAAADGVSMLFAGTAMELLGQSVTEMDGTTYGGIGLAGFATVHGTRRIVGDVYGHSALCPDPVVGFVNKNGTSAGIETPLLDALDMGFGNERERGPEGFRQGNVWASELTGPLLVKNPRLLELTAAALLERRGLEPPVTYPVDEWAEKGYAVTARELKARCGNGR